MRILVFGFSVTGEKEGFVEQTDRMFPEHEIFKVAIGGLQPDHGWHLIPGIVRRHRPDALIIEEATAVYRKRPEDPNNTARHTEALEHVFRVCDEIGARVGFFDLPLTGVEDEADWLPRMHADLARKYSLPHVNLPLDTSLLRDLVHTNEEGKVVYANAFRSLVEEVADSTPDFTPLPARRGGLEAFALQDVEVSSDDFGEFERTGLTVKLLNLPQGREVHVTMPKPVRLLGFIMTFGPLTGDAVFRIGDTEHTLHSYDRHCYYLRLGGKPIRPVVAQEFTVCQSAEIPEDELVKGDKNTDPRVGGLAYILYDAGWEG